MAGAALEVTWYGYEQVLAALKRRPDLQAMAEEAGEEMVTVVEDAFAKERDPVTGRKWKPSGRVIKDKGNLTLTESAALRRSFDYNAFPDGSALVGSNKVYARIHNQGGEAGPKTRRVKIPQRRMLGTPPDFVERLLENPVVKKVLGI
jgi:phage virion morphogenesis protein